MRGVPCNLLVFTLPRLHRQTHLVHLVNIASRLHIGKDVILQLGHGLKWVRYVLVLLNVADHFCRLCSLGKVDQVRLLDQRRDAIFDKGQISQVDACFG